MKLHYKSKKSILAFGVDGKARFAFANGSDIEISRDFGSLQDAGNFERYERSIKQLIKKEKPQILACDLHPEYNSTKLAKKLYGLQATGYRLQAIQHHHAHIASCIADNGLTSRVIGVAFDGTGFGIDGNIWGGEIFLATPTKFRRVWHLDYVPMPGAEAAVKEPWRMALSYLYKYYGDRFLNLKIPFVKFISKNKVLVLKKMIKKGINSPLTSSIGRLFDAAGALINLTNSVRYEGEAAIRLEALAAARIEIKSYYKASVHTRDLIRGIVNDLKR